MGKNEFIQLQIIDITQLQQKNVGGIRSNENLILVEIADGRPFGQNFTPVGGGGGGGGGGSLNIVGSG